MSKPLLSMLCITYNQEKYISKTLDGFLMQKTSFPFEVLIHDDASTDGTAEIIKRYAKNHPKIFRTIFEKENQYSKGNITVFLEKMYKTARGKYIAWSEGDDYWTDPSKVQHQVDFLEENPDYSICFHPVKVIHEDSNKEEIYPDSKKGSEFTKEELLQRNFIQTNSVMYRTQKYKGIPRGVMPVDWYMHLYHAQFGKIGFIDRVMSVYRRHPGGIWWESQRNIDEVWKNHGINHINLYKELLKLYGNKKEYREIINRNIYIMINRVLLTDRNTRESLIKDFPEYTMDYLIEQFDLLQNLKIKSEEQKHEIKNLKNLLAEKGNEIELAQHELNLIKSSKVWKFRNKVSQFLGREK